MIADLLGNLRRHLGRSAPSPSRGPSPRLQMRMVLLEVRDNLARRSPEPIDLPYLYLVDLPRPADFSLWRPEHQAAAWRTARAWAAREHGEWILSGMPETLPENSLASYRSASIRGAWWGSDDGTLPRFIDGTLFVCDLNFMASRPRESVRDTVAHETYHALTTLDRLRAGQYAEDLTNEERTANLRQEEGAADTFPVLFAKAREQEAALERILETALWRHDPFLEKDWRDRVHADSYPFPVAEGVLRRLIAEHGRDLERLDVHGLLEINDTIWRVLDEHGLVAAWCDANACLAVSVKFSGPFTRAAWERFLVEDTETPEFLKQVISRHLARNQLPLPGYDAVGPDVFSNLSASVLRLPEDAWARGEEAALERAKAVIARCLPENGTRLSR